MSLSISQALAQFENHKESDGMLPASYVPETALDLAKLRQQAGIADAIDNHLAWERKVKTAALNAKVEDVNDLAEATTANGRKKLKWVAFEDKDGKLPRILTSEASRKAYVAYRMANEAAAIARVAFEKLGRPEITAAITKATGRPVPTGKGVLITYKFGRINVAIGDATQAAADTSLADLY